MSILSCLHPVSPLPEARSRQQIVLPAIHGADDSAPPERPNARARRLAAPPTARSPQTGSPPRTSGMSGADRGKSAGGQPPSFCRRGILGRRSWPGRPQAIAIDLTSRMESALDIASPGRRASPCSSPARAAAGSPGGTSTAPTAAVREPYPWLAPHRNATPVAGGGCRDHRPAQPRT